MKKIVFVVLNVLLAVVSNAQTFSTSSDIYLGLKKLNVLGSVLYIAAHPDDENTRLLTYFSKDKLYRTGYLSLTRGDGGQNLIGDEQGIALGLIRTQELLSARRIDGAEQFFTRAYDFGFSKTPQETFTKWDKEKILADVVWVIRKFQPDVIITRFPTTGEGGHGHHTASAILANEAFIAAADPSRFPEQLKYVQPWQAKRILWNTFNFGNTNTTNNDQFHFDVGGYNAVLGKSYGEIAAQSRSQHKSQGFGVSASRGEALEYFKTTGGATPSADLFEDVTVDWQRVKGSEHLQQLINTAIQSFDFLQPQKTVPQLVQIYKALKTLPENYWKDQKLKETQRLIEDACGLWIDAFTNEPFVSQTDSIKINFALNNRLGGDIRLNSIQIEGFDSSFRKDLLKNKNFGIERKVYIPQSKSITQPYWLQNKMGEGYFNINDQKLIGQADIPPALVALIKLSIDAEEFVIEKAIKYKFTDPVKGEIYWPFWIVPPYSLKINPEFHLGITEQVAYQRTFTSYKNNNLITSYKIPGISKCDSFRLNKNIIRTVEDFAGFDIQSMRDNKNSNKTQRFTLDKTQEYYFLNKIGGEKLYDLTTIQYDHIPVTRYFKEAKITFRNFDLNTVGKRIGYITGAGDKVPEALEQMGYEVTILTDKELSRNHLQQFDAIITGVRAYNTDEWLNNHYEKLMKYVELGGNVIVQYNTSTNIGPVKAKIGPFSFDISRNRITDENAAVSFLQPGHAVLNFPNKINDNDFKGWVQERSIYHAAKLDSNFQTILRMNDPGEAPDDGSLVIAKYGKGFFTYTGLVFFRELPAGVPGAYRLLANLIALNRKREF